MRILLALMFSAPIIAFVAMQSGAESVTPFLAAAGFVAILLQVLIERRA